MDLKVTKLTGVWAKSIGLIGQKNITPVYFRTRFGIHTFGVRSAIDILVLDHQNKVVRIGQNIYPNSLFFWPPVYDQIIELPVGWLKSHKILIGTEITIIP